MKSEFLGGFEWLPRLRQPVSSKVQTRPGNPASASIRLSL